MAVLWNITRTNTQTGAEKYVARVSETEIWQLVYNTLHDIGEHPYLAKAAARSAVELLRDGEPYTRYHYRFTTEVVE